MAFSRGGRRRLVRRLRRCPAVFGVLVVVGGIVLVISLPVTLPLVAMLHARDLRRRHTAAARFACVSCGRVLGPVALERAEAAWVEYVAQLSRRHPGCRFRLVRDLHAVCPACGARYRFDEQRGTFSALDTSNI